MVTISMYLVHLHVYTGTFHSHFFFFTVIQLGENIEVNRDGFVEFNKSLLSATPQQEEVIKFTLKTTEKEGLVLWKGQPSPLQRSSSIDYLSLGLQDGYVVYR